MHLRRSLRLALPLLLIAGPAFAFEVPLTKTQRAQKLVEEGQVQILRGEFRQAIDSCTQALRVRTDWAPAYLCRGEARLMTRDARADQDALSAARLDPESGGPYRLLGILEYRAARYAAALTNFNEALKRAKIRPEDLSDVYYYRAQTELAQGDSAEALKNVDKALGIALGLNGDFTNWTFYSLRAEIYRRQNNDAKADQDERQVLRIIDERLRNRPEERDELLLKRAESRFLLRQYDLAAADYSEVLSRDKNNVELLLDRAQIYFTAGRYEASIKDLDRVLELDPRQLPALRLRALARINMGDNLGAVGDLDAYLEIEPTDASALADRGIAKKFLEDYRGSLSDLNSAQALGPNVKSSLWGHKAMAQEMLGDHEAAMNSSEQALKENPDDFSAHLARARAAMILGLREEAAPSLDWLVRKFPTSGYYLWLRGECRCGIREDERCLRDLEAAALLEPRSPILVERLALHYRRFIHDRRSAPPAVEELRLSKKYYDQAVALGGVSTQTRLDRIDAMASLAERLARRGSTRRESRRLAVQAEEELRNLDRKNPGNTQTRRLRARLQKILRALRKP